MATHEIPLERRTLHGHFSRELEPILTVELRRFDRLLVPQRRLARAARRAGSPGAIDGQLDAGHALIGPVEVRAARAGQTLEVRIDEVRIGSSGFTRCRRLDTALNERLGVDHG